MLAPLRLEAEATALSIILQSESLGTATIYARQRQSSGTVSGTVSGTQTCPGSGCPTSGSSSSSIRSASQTSSSTQVQPTSTQVQTTSTRVQPTKPPSTPSFLPTQPLSPSATAPQASTDAPLSSSTLVQSTSTKSKKLPIPGLHPTQILNPGSIAPQDSSNAPSAGLRRARIAGAAIGGFIVFGLGMMALLSFIRRRRRVRRKPRASVLIEGDAIPRFMSEKKSLILPTTPNTPNTPNTPKSPKIQRQSSFDSIYQETSPVGNTFFDGPVINSNRPSSHYSLTFGPPITPAVPSPTYGPPAGIPSPGSARQSFYVVSPDIPVELPYFEPSIHSRTPSVRFSSEPRRPSLHSERLAYKKSFDRNSEKAATEAGSRIAQYGAAQERPTVYWI